MKAVPVQAHQIASIGGARSTDGKFGLIRFVREKPMQDGTKDVWVALPNAMLPYLATVAVTQLPQPQGGTIPHIMPAKGLAMAVGSKGEILLSLKIEQGASLSYQLDRGQAESLLAELRNALGDKGKADAPKAKRAPAKGAAKVKKKG